jgi:hypothetical protein
MGNDDNMVELADGDVRAWIEQGQSVCIKAITRFGDPVELEEKEVRKLAESLLRFYQAIHD